MWELSHSSLERKSRKIKANQYLLERRVRDRYELLPIERVEKFNRFRCLLPFPLHCIHSGRTLHISVLRKRLEQHNNLTRRTYVFFIILFTSKMVSILHHLNKTMNCYMNMWITTSQIQASHSPHLERWYLPRLCIWYCRSPDIFSASQLANERDESEALHT